MQIVKPTIPVNFNYVTFDQVTSLSVAGLVYNTTTGTPVLESTVAMLHSGAGVYVGSFVPVLGQRYLIIAAVFTDGTFATADPDRAASAEDYVCGDPGSTHLLFNYVSFDHDATLKVAGNLYSVMNSTPTFVSQIAMAHVALGVYFGFATGTFGTNYLLVKLVYTDSGLTIVDTARAPGSDTFQCFVIVTAMAGYLSSVRRRLFNQSEISRDHGSRPELSTLLPRNSEIQKRLDNKAELRGRLINCGTT